jgi:hypothetical protein
MMGGMTAFMIAVSGTSLICYLLMTRVQYRTARRRGTADDGGSSYSSGGDRNIFGWFSSDNSTSPHSGASGDFGSGDSRGGDSGGGGDGGGSGDQGSADAVKRRMF